VEGFQKNKVIFHVDTEAGEINNRLKNCIGSVCDAHAYLQEALKYFGTRQVPDFSEWNARISSLKSTWPDTSELRDVQGINPNFFMHKLSDFSMDARVFLADVGNHQMWTAQSLQPRENQLFLTSAGMGAMGYALPAAIGASVALDNSPTVVIAGDGGFQLNIQELQTIVRNRLPVKMVVLNNQCLGMIRQFQDSYFESRYQSTYLDYSAPDFKAVAEGYGIPALTVTQTAELDEALTWLWAQPGKPSLLQVMIDPYANAYPKIAFGKPITEMEPFSAPIDMEGT